MLFLGPNGPSIPNQVMLNCIQDAEQVDLNSVFGVIVNN